MASDLNVRLKREEQNAPPASAYRSAHGVKIGKVCETKACETEIEGA